MQVVINHNLDELAAKIGQVGDVLHVQARSVFHGAVDVLSEAGTEEFKSFTPYGREPVDILNYEHLRDTTEHLTDHTGDLSAVTEFHQDKVTQDRQGREIPLWEMLTDGRRGPSTVIMPQNKQALYWVGINPDHPVGSSQGGPAPANPYIAEAWASYLPQVELGLSIAGDEAMYTALEVLHA